MTDTAERDSVSLTPPTLLAYNPASGGGPPGAAFQIPSSAEDGDTFFASIDVAADGAIIGNSAIFALVVGVEPNVCVGWGQQELWDYGDNCKGGGFPWAILIPIWVAVAAAAYFFLM